MQHGRPDLQGKNVARLLLHELTQSGQLRDVASTQCSVVCGRSMTALSGQTGGMQRSDLLCLLRFTRLNVRELCLGARFPPLRRFEGFIAKSKRLGQSLDLRSTRRRRGTLLKVVPNKTNCVSRDSAFMT